MTRKLVILLMLAFAFVFPASSEGGKPLVSVSSLVIQWNQPIKKFEALFSVTNNTDKDLELSTILRFQTQKKRRWRGALLPLIPKNSTEHFKIAFSAELMLKNNYTDISILVYENKYSGYLDNSRNYIRIKTTRYVVNDSYQVKISQTKLPDTETLEPQPVQKKDRTIVLGPVTTFSPRKAATAKKSVRLQALVKPQSLAGEEQKTTEADKLPLAGKWITIDPAKTKETVLQQAVASKASPDLVQEKERPLSPTAEPLPTVETILLAAPIVEVVAAADGKIEIKWSSQEKTKQFLVYWSDIPLITKENSTKVSITGQRFVHDNLINDKKYYYAVSAISGSKESSLSNEIEAEPKSTAIIEIPVEVLLVDIDPDDFTRIDPIQELTVAIADSRIAKEEALKRAQALEALDIQSREKLIALYIAEGKSEAIAELLSTQLDKNPENLDLSLSLSKVYHEQGDTAAALNVLTASLNRISLSARLALNQELKATVKEGATTIKGQSEESFLADEFSKLGISLLDKEKYTDALSAFQSLHSLAQDYPFLEYYLGKCRQGLKQYNQAKQHFITQSKKKIDFNQNLTNLDSLADVLPFSLELQDVDYAIGGYKTIASKAGPEKQAKIKSQLDTLGLLMVKARDKRFGNLADLAVKLPESVQLADIQPGQDFVVKLAVENVGRKASGDFNVYYQLKHESGIFYEVSDIDRFKAIQPNSPLFQWDKHIVLPQKAITGNYQLIVNLEQIEGLDEITLNNNTLTTASDIKVIPPIAELAIAFREKPVLFKVNRKEGVVADLIVTNNGYMPSPAFKIEYQLEGQDGGMYEYKDEQLLQKISQRDRLLIKDKQIPVPDDFAEGLYNLKAKLVLENEAAEINKKNNRTESGFTYQFPDRFDGRPEAGIKYYSQLIQEEPDVIRNRVKLSRYYRILDQDEDALSILNQASVYVARQLNMAASNQPGSSPQFKEEDLKSLKAELKKTGDQFAAKPSYQQALTSYQSLQTLDPDYPQIHRLSGRCRIGLGQYTLAKNEYLAQVEQTPDYQSLSDLKTVLGFGNDLDNMVKARNSFIQLKQTHAGENAKDIDLQVADLNTMIEKTKTTITQAGSDLVIAIENPPGIIAIRPKAVLELEFSLSNLGKTLSNPARVHYQFISRNGNVYDTETATRFDQLDPEHKTVFWDEELAVPENIVGGTYQVRAALEFEKNKADKDELNNQVVSDFLFVYSEPDIAISNFSHQVMKIQRKSSIIMTQLTWENQGGNPATKNRLLIFLENVGDSNDIKLLKEEPLSDVPAISETVAMSHELVIPNIESEKRYKLVAEIKSEGDLKENSLANNRFESNQLIEKNVAPIVIAGIILNSRITYPGKKVDLEIRLRNNQSTQAIKDIALEFRLQDETGKTCCAVIQKVDEIPPSLAVVDKDGKVDVKDFIFKCSLDFPGISKGEYQVEAKLLSAATIDLQESPTVIRSTSKLSYGDATFQITNFYPIRDILIPGKETRINITILNNGENKSFPEKLEFFLEGNQSLPIGLIEVEAIAPAEQSVTLNKSIHLPDILPQGAFTLVLRKNETPQGAAQVLRYRNPVIIQNVQPIAPQEFESFRQNESPLFTWNSIDNLTYRLAFSTDREFKDDAKVFRIPDNTWLKRKQYQLKPGEWSMVWLLSQHLKKDVYWQIEAKSTQNTIIRGLPQKIRFKQAASE